MDLRRWFGHAEPEEVEIGGTWLNADVQRTPVNTEAKLLLFTHAFEVWQVRRVGAEHRRAQRAQSPGDRADRRVVSRACCVTTGRRRSPASRAGPRNSAMFAVVDDDWPAVAAQLRARLTHPPE